MASNSIMLLIDPSNGKILDANPTACDFYGYDRNKFKNTLYVHDLNTLSSKEIEVEMQDAVKNNRKYFNFNHRLASGEIRSIEVYTTKLIENEKTILFSIIHDITDRKILEEELRKSKEQYELIANNTSDSIAILSFDEKLTYLYVNKTYNNEKGFDPDFLIGKSLFDLVHPDDKKQILLKLQSYLKLKNSVKSDSNFPKVEIFEFRFKTNDGKWRYMRSTVNAIGDDLLAVSKDITDIKTYEKSLRKSKEQYELIAENTSDSIVIVSFDENLTYLYANPTDDNELSLKPEQLLGKSLFEFIHPDDVNDIHIILKKYLKIKKDNPTDTRLQNINETLEFRAISPDGSWRHMQTTVNPIGNDLLAVSKNVTNLKIFEKSLRESKEHAENLLNISAGIIISLDTTGKITLLNDSGYKLLGFKKGTLLGKNWFDNCVPKDLKTEIKTVFASLMNGNLKNARYYENSVLTKNGDEKIISWHNTLLYDSDNNIVGLISSGQDVTSKKNTETELKINIERFERLAQNAPDIIYRYKFYPEAGFDYISPAVTKITGYTPEDHYNDPQMGFKLIHPDDKLELEKLEKGIVPKSPHIVRWIRKDGRTIWIEDRTTPIFDKNGDLIEIEGIARDISKQIEIEIELNNSYERYQNFLSLSTSGIWRMELNKPCPIKLPEKQLIKAIMDNRIAECNDAFAKMYGYKNRKDILGISLSDFITEENAIEVIKTVIKNGYSFSGVETEEFTIDGREIYFNNSIYATIKDGVLYRFWGIQEDITEQKLAQIAIKESEEKFAYLFNSSPNVITISNIKDGTILEINETGLKELGYKKNEVIGKSAIDLGLITQKQRATLVEPLIKKGYYSDIEIPVTLKSGKSVIGLFYGQIIQLEEKDYLFQTIVDISKPKNLEKEIIASRKKYQDLFDNAPDMHFSVDVNGKVLSVNKGGAEYLGYDTNELIGKPVWKVVYKKDLKNVKLQIGKIINTGKKYSDIEFRKIKKDGTIIFVQERIQCINNDEGKPSELRIVCRDITEREKTRQKIIDYQENLKSMTYELGSIEDDTKRQIASRLHDDIGQAMALSKITLSNITENMPFSEISKKIEDAKSFLTNAIKSSRDLTYEISPPILHELGLGAAIKWYTDQINTIFDIKFQITGQNINIIIPENISILLYKSIIELINNIIKHSNATLVTISMSHFKSFIRITVKDNGIGFKNKSWKNLSKNKKFGLFSISERLKYIGGNFKIESERKKGSKITIKVPV